MLILALDTATESGSLALAEGEKLLVETSLERAGTYLSRLLPSLVQLFEAAGRDPAALQAVGVSVGPGNFTGLRIGLATAKTLAWSLSCPLVPVPTLEVLAAQVPEQNHPIGVVMDAKRGEVFWGLYQGPAERPQMLAAPIRLPLAGLSRHLIPPLVLTGSMASSLPSLPREGVSLAPPESRLPRAATVARLALSLLSAGQTARPEQLTPTYLRPAL
ncbi:MAG: tRNA (adenosine(37)-N6)-threonylcarbamoyltransferase complex dimerization subunit type 1 TsaB [Deltaproteobacteria bacterium]|nr:tRNA (adenosine(37)-N6)-threonylcarbamoyltransferase complex dimerization subunit type 1 TsaB [Deltaproteobacteria bacterium]